MTKDEALKLALEALEGMYIPNFTMDDSPINKAITAIKEALAQHDSVQAKPEPEQEPVALPCCGYADASAVKWNSHNQVVQCHNCGQIYTTPPQRTWVGLTNNDLQPIAEEYRILFGSWVHDFARAIEAKLKEKNT